MHRAPFLDELAAAIRADEKTVTRRVTAPRFKVGDVVGVCEALVPDCGWVAYRGDCTAVLPGQRRAWVSPLATWPWKVKVLPARYCPNWAIRTFIRITDIRPEPLDAVTDDEARREGIVRLGYAPTREGFLAGFRKLHRLVAEADPEVWRVEFRREVAGG